MAELRGWGESLRIEIKAGIYSISVLMSALITGYGPACLPQLEVCIKSNCVIHQLCYMIVKQVSHVRGRMQATGI